MIPSDLIDALAGYPWGIRELVVAMLIDDMHYRPDRVAEA